MSGDVDALDLVAEALVALHRLNLPGVERACGQLRQCGVGAEVGGPLVSLTAPMLRERFQGSTADSPAARAWVRGVLARNEELVSIAPHHADEVFASYFDGASASTRSAVPPRTAFFVDLCFAEALLRESRRGGEDFESVLHARLARPEAFATAG